MNKGNKLLAFCLVCVLCIGCDRITKDLARAHLKNHEPISWLHNSFRLEYVENTGAFLSLGEHWPPEISFWCLSVLPLMVLLGFFISLLRRYQVLPFVQMLPFALILAGGLGNIIDRLLYNRHVTDFMNLGVWGLRTGIFNFADLQVTTGILLMLLVRFRGPASGNLAAGKI
jgi:signal peptidase II